MIGENAAIVKLMKDYFDNRRRVGEEITVMHDARNVANEFIRRASESGDQFTHLQVQKLVYYAHAWMLGLYGRPLIEESFEVWRYGPVVSSVYYSLSHYRGSPITEAIPLHQSDKEPYDHLEEDVINQVYSKYGHLSGLELSSQTHAPGTPWHQAKKNWQSYIANSAIERYFSKLVKQAKKRQHA